jgi:hypothetical protein
MSFKKMFSVPRTPNTSFSPGQAFSLRVPRGMKAIITDIYIENLGGGLSVFQISEKTGTNTYEIRYSFRTPDNDRTVLNFTTGLRLKFNPKPKNN